MRGTDDPGDRTQPRRTPSSVHRLVHCSGFSLIELMAVIVLMGLMATAGIVVFAGQIDQARLSQAVDRILAAEHEERRSLRVSPVPGGVKIESQPDRLRFQTCGKDVTLGPNVRIKGWLTTSPNGEGNQVPYTQQAQSPTWAIQLATRRNASRWIVVIGLSGQVLVTDDSQRVLRLLQARSD